MLKGDTGSLDDGSYKGPFTFLLYHHRSMGSPPQAYVGSLDTKQGTLTSILEDNIVLNPFRMQLRYPIVPLK